MEIHSLKLFVLVFIVAIPLATTAAQGPVNFPVESVETLQELANLSQANSEFIKPSDTKNIVKFCQINGFRDRGESFQSTSQYSVTGWADTFFATYESRRDSFLIHHAEAGANAGMQFSMFSAAREEKAWVEIFDFLNSPENAIPRREEFETAIDQMNSSDIQSDQADDLKAGKAQFSYICSDINVKSLEACARGLDLIQKISKPVGNVTMLPLWAEIFKDEVYMRAFRKVALKISQSLQSNSAPTTTFFEDLQAAFYPETKDLNKAADYTWKTMAVLASGGGNVGSRPEMISTGGAPLLEGVLNILSLGSMALDRLTVQKGFLYTYPREINNVCDYGKNYHFWMTAYLAREVMKSTKSLHGSAAAAFSAQKGYQFAKKSDGRVPAKPFTQNLYSNYTNNIRLDLTLAAAGAWFGAQSMGKIKKLSQAQVNHGIDLTFDGSKSPTAHYDPTSFDFNLSSAPEALKLYSDWKKITNPDAAYKYFQRELGQ